ncbi:hypothetical protein H9L39_10980 [Fusarium oxysporum f. sp. albedinis]|jgi:hypothetical protein|nr:hypothetical protein H9L39_10980 [Fusarium oxysporum f. sp. albedinis]
MLPQPCTADPALAWWERKRTGRLNGTARASRDAIQKIGLDSKAPVVALVSSHCAPIGGDDIKLCDMDSFIAEP